jgi:hypothetical protein
MGSRCGMQTTDFAEVRPRFGEQWANISLRYIEICILKIYPANAY